MLSRMQTIVVLKPKDFNYVTFFQSPYRFKKFALLFSVKLKMPHHLPHGDLSGSTSLKSLLQVFYDKPFDSSTLPSGVSNKNGNCPKHLLRF